MISIGILVFDEVEILDFAGPFEVFSTAARVHARTAGAASLFRCFLVATEMRPIRSRGGMKVLPACVLPPLADVDVLIVPGGDITSVQNDAALAGWIRSQAASTQIIASVCTGAFLLGRAGLLAGIEATTHWQDQAALQAQFPATTVRNDVPWVDCGRVVTSAGIAAGIDMSLHLVDRLAGRQLANATAKQMQYRWDSNGTDHRRQTADTGVFSAA